MTNKKPISDVFNMDCMDYMRSLPDHYFHLAIADPPYGLDKRSTQGAGKLKDRVLNEGNIKRWDTSPTLAFFDELRRVSEHQIIWGGNYFPLPPCRCFVCWDKQQPWPNFSQVEFAWTSFDMPAKLFRFDNRVEKIHPTQKPVELYHYLLKTFAHVGGGDFRPHDGQSEQPYSRLHDGFRLCRLRDRQRLFRPRLRPFRSRMQGQGLTAKREDRRAAIPLLSENN